MSAYSIPRIKFIPLAVAALLGGISATSFGAPVVYGNITLDAEYSLNNGSMTNGMAPPSSIYSNADGADMYLNHYVGGSNVFFHTYGFSGSSTYFGARASGQGQFYGMTRSSFEGTFINTSSFAQAYAFTFHVLAGDVGISGTGATSADLMLKVSKNGVVKSQDHTTISQDTDGNIQCVVDDIGTLSSYMGCPAPNTNSTSASDGSFTVDFGVIAAGEQFTLNYDIIATVAGNAALTGTTHQECTYTGGYGDVNTAFAYGGYGGYGGGQVCTDVPDLAFLYAQARSGDPFGGPAFDNNGNFTDGTNGNPIVLQTSQAPADVPEPGTLALGALALAGLAAARRKKKSSTPA